MDKAKEIMKNGWQPAGDRKISRDTWKSDLKGIATGKKKDPLEDARNHQSAPLTTLRDPDTFAPPPKHTAYYGPDGRAASIGTGASSSNVTGPPRLTGGLGAPVVETGYAQRKAQTMQEREAQEQAEIERQKQEPYRKDTSGLRTDHLPPPPKRTVTGSSIPNAGGRPPPALPPRLPPRQVTGTVPLVSSGHNTGSVGPSRVASPAPFLPPRQNEYPDEFTPPPPPSYGEAVQAPQAAPPAQNHYEAAIHGAAQRFGGAAASSWQKRSNADPAAINTGASGRLAQAGVSVPGFGIGANGSSRAPTAQQAAGAATFAQGAMQGATQRFGQAGPSNSSSSGPGHGGQLSELQQRFARLGAAAQENRSAPGSPSASTTQKKAPPPPPPKNSGLAVGPAGSGLGGQPGAAAPPPIPMSSKPRPL